MAAGLVSTATVARALHVSEATIRSYAESGLIPCVRTLRGHRRFDLNAVLFAWQHHSDAPADEFKTAQVDEVQPIEVSAAWKNEWAIAALRSDEDDQEQVASLLQPEPFPGVRGETRFVVSRRLVGV